MNKNELLTRIHDNAMDVINDTLITLQDQTADVGEIPRRFADYCHDEDHDVLWWETSMTGGEITEPPSYIGGPECHDWPFDPAENDHLLWVPLPKLARSKP
jgi:hypothetical protein